MARSMAVVLGVFGLVVAACSSAATSTTTTLAVAPDGAATLILYVSNQSFDDDPVGLIVEIDDSIVVDREFFVEGQHNWIEFELALDGGSHTIEAVSSTGASYRAEFEMPATGMRWAVLDYWFYPDEGSRHLTFDIHDTEIGFAQGGRDQVG